MIFDRESAMQQIGELLHRYTCLQIFSDSNNKIILSGSILVNRVAKGYTVHKEYQILIVIPIFSDELPYVLDVGHYIDEHYPHRYTDGRLCLETDTCIRVRFAEGFSLSAWMSEYVEIYFFSYEYHNRFGEFPFGERGHGLEGIFQTYEELFNESDTLKIFYLMESIITQRYRGHMLCPCGSGKKLRVCHGKEIMKYYTDERLNKIVRDDYQTIREALIKYNG